MYQENFELLDLVPVGAFILNRDYRIVFWNRRLEEWTRLGRDRTLDRRITDLAPDFNNPRVIKRIDSVFDTGLPTIFSPLLNQRIIPVAAKNGEKQIHHTTVTPIPASGGGYNALFTVQDVTDLHYRIRGYREMRDRALREVEERRRVEEQLRGEKEKAEEMAHKLRLISSLDGLTGIPNRRYFNEMYEREWRRALRSRLTMGFIMLDIDFFKKYNDNLGHQAGDECLRLVAESLHLSVKRPGDFICRYGGEEFAVILPATSLEGAALIAENIRTAIESLSIPRAYTKVSNVVTASFGVSATVPGSRTGAGELIKAADQALYKAKDEGRNRVVVERIAASA